MLMFALRTHPAFQHKCGLGSRASCRGKRAALAVRMESRVHDLLDRDKKTKEVVDLSAFDDAPGDAAPAAAAAAPAEKPSSKKQQPTAAGPQRSREAIDLGLQKFQAGEYRAAIELFELALELPGSGVMRMAGSVREYACPSEGEEHSALYNMACAYARLGQRGPALTCLEGLLDSGFEDFAAIRNDPDLAPVRGPELEQLLAKHDNLVTKLLGKKKKDQEGVLGKKSQWITW